MSEKDKNRREEFTVEIEKSEAGTRIRIVEVSVGANRNVFDQAYRLVSDLHRRTTDLDTEIQLVQRTERARSMVEGLWKPEGDTATLSTIVSDKSHRIALVLLRSYPEFMRISDVAGEAGVPRETVRNQLKGDVEAVAEFFVAQDKGFQLSHAGLDWVIDNVIPLVLDRTEAFAE